MKAAYVGDWPDDLLGKSVLVVNPLRASWSLAILAEVALRARRDGANVYWLDLPLTVTRAEAESCQLNDQDRWRPWLRPDPLRKMREVLSRSGVTILASDRYESVRTCDVPMTLPELDAYEYRGYQLGWAVHASISGQFFRHQVPMHSRRFRRRVKHQINTGQTWVHVLEKACEQGKPDFLFTTNDRCLGASLALQVGRGLGVDSRVVYWGSTPHKIMVYGASLHSRQDRARHVQKLWSSAQSDVSATTRALEALEVQRAGSNDVGELDFRRGMRPGLVPARSRPKRISVFLSTPWEFSGVLNSDKKNADSQHAAVLQLIESLDADEWEVVVRHHPAHPYFGDRSEKSAWGNALRRPNVLEVDGDSPMDSLELAKSSDISAVYISSIGITLIAMGLKVLVLGPAFWCRPDWHIEFSDLQHEEKALEHSIPVVPPEELAPVLHYLGCFGDPFQYVAGNGSHIAIAGDSIFTDRVPSVAKRQLLPLYWRWLDWRQLNK